MAQFTLGDIKYKQRAVNNMIHPEKLTEIEHLTQNQMQAHTCSETSYRITDVECIVRAKTLPLNLTGHSKWPGVRNSGEEFFLRPC